MLYFFALLKKKIIQFIYTLFYKKIAIICLFALLKCYLRYIDNDLGSTSITNNL